jgi:cell division protein FtsX
MALALAFAAATGLGARALERMAAAQEAALSQERIARLAAPDGDAALREARSALARSPDVREARILSAEEAQTLLSGWAEDAAVPEAALEDLRLIVVRLEATAPPDIAERLQADLAEAGLSVEIVGPGAMAARAARGPGGSQFAGLSFAALIVAAGVVGFAGRAAAAAHAATAGLLAGLGASRAQVQTAIARPIAGAGFTAGLLGAVLAAASWGAVAGLWPEAAAIRPSGAAPLTLADIAPLAAAPVIGYLAARSGARAGAGRSFDRADFSP